ncbi:MAG: hypothetical protein AAFN10_11040 [Bacteroidota bacterium]
MNRFLFGWLGILMMLGLACAEPFAFELEREDIDFAALGSGKIIASSYGHYKNYYIDIDAQEIYLLPLPKNNENNLAVDPQGKFVYSIDGRDIYRAVPGIWDWEILPFKVPAGRDESGWVYNLEIDPTGSTLYFIWAKRQGPDRPLMSLDLNTGDTTNISQQLDFDVWDFSINPVSGDLLIPYFRATDSLKVLIRLDPKSLQRDSLFTFPLGQYENFVSLPPLTWLPNGEELAVIFPHNPDSIFRINLQSQEHEAMYDRHQLSYYHSPFAFNPSGERLAIGFNDAFQVDLWDPSRTRSDYSKKLIFLGDICDYSCYGASEIYWFP